jgi:hypothetical protein
VAATLALLVLITPISATSARAVEPISPTIPPVVSVPMPVITVPDGTTVAGLSVPMGAGTDPSISVSGCTVGDVVDSLTIELSVPIGGGLSSEVPILLDPVETVPQGGIVDYPLRPVSEWLVMQHPAPGAQIIITAYCLDTTVVGGSPIGAMATLAIPAGIGVVGSPTTIPPTAPGPVQSPDPVTVAASPVGEPVKVSNEATANTNPSASTLAYTGANVSTLIIPLAVGLLLLLSGLALRTARVGAGINSRIARFRRGQ